MTKLPEPIDIFSMMESLMYLSSDNATVKKALVVAHDLQEQIRYAPNAHSTVTVTLSYGSITITVGDVIVWYSEEDEAENLNVEFCRTAFLDDLKRQIELFERDKEGESIHE